MGFKCLFERSAPHQVRCNLTGKSPAIPNVSYTWNVNTNFKKNRQMRFSQRIGKKPIKTVLQIESIDEDLKNRLWNATKENFFDKLKDYASYGAETEKGKVCKFIWMEFFKNPVDKIPSFSNSPNVDTYGFMSYLRKWFYSCEWYEIYDLIEFLSYLDNDLGINKYVPMCNWALEVEVSGYRIINGKIAQITSEQEVLAIEEAARNTDKWKSVNTHLKTSLDYLSDRKTPDYRNSIKEAISAVESFCKIITNDDKATLGKALVEIEKTHKIHKALKNAFSSIYGYTSDSSGIRHALLESDTTVSFEEAKFMLVSCSAFINYLKMKIK